METGTTETRSNQIMTYRIVRFYRNDYTPTRTIERGLTLEEAQEHCKDPETSSRTCTKPAATRRTRRLGDWFDGYTSEG